MNCCHSVLSYGIQQWVALPKIVRAAEWVAVVRAKAIERVVEGDAHVPLNGAAALLLLLNSAGAEGGRAGG